MSHYDSYEVDLANAENGEEKLTKATTKLMILAEEVLKKPRPIPKPRVSKANKNIKILKVVRDVFMETDENVEQIYKIHLLKTNSRHINQLIAHKTVSETKQEKVDTQESKICSTMESNSFLQESNKPIQNESWQTIGAEMTSPNTTPPIILNKGNITPNNENNQKSAGKPKTVNVDKSNNKVKSMSNNDKPSEKSRKSMENWGKSPVSFKTFVKRKDDPLSFESIEMEKTQRENKSSTKLTSDGEMDKTQTKTQPRKQKKIGKKVERTQNPSSTNLIDESFSNRDVNSENSISSTKNINSNSDEFMKLTQRQTPNSYKKGIRFTEDFTEETQTITPKNFIEKENSMDRTQPLNLQRKLDKTQLSSARKKLEATQKLKGNSSMDKTQKSSRKSTRDSLPPPRLGISMDSTQVNEFVSLERTQSKTPSRRNTMEITKVPSKISGFEDLMEKTQIKSPRSLMEKILGGEEILEKTQVSSKRVKRRGRPKKIRNASEKTSIQSTRKPSDVMENTQQSPSSGNKSIITREKIATMTEKQLEKITDEIFTSPDENNLEGTQRENEDDFYQKMGLEIETAESQENIPVTDKIHNSYFNSMGLEVETPEYDITEDETANSTEDLMDWTQSERNPKEQISSQTNTNQSGQISNSQWKNSSKKTNVKMENKQREDKFIMKFPSVEEMDKTQIRTPPRKKKKRGKKMQRTQISSPSSLIDETFPNIEANSGSSIASTKMISSRNFEFMERTQTSTPSSDKKAMATKNEQISIVDTEAKNSTHLQHLAQVDVLGEPNVDRKTKIICTIGPACRDVNKLQEMIVNGMNIARMNFSHGTHKYHAETMANVRQAISNFRETPVVAISLDTKGPEIRTGILACEKNGKKEVQLVKWEQITLTIDDKHKEMCTVQLLWIDYKNISRVVKPDSKIYIDDGLISLVVEKIQGSNVLCRIENGGLLGSRKGVNLPGTNVDLPAISRTDIEDLQFGVKHNVDIIFASFIRDANGVRTIRKHLGKKGKHIKIISKIENQQGIINIDEIIKESDGIMVARGDLGIEIPVEKVFKAQKMMITKCNMAGKPIICATQMLESMVYKPRPTRAEVSDVANAVLDGADCVMLSAETAKGDYPLEAVAMMHQICREAESTVYHTKFMEEMLRLTPRPTDIAHTIAIAAVTAAVSCKASAIIALSTTGKTGQLISALKAPCITLCLTRRQKTARFLQLYYGILPVYIPEPPDENWTTDVDLRVSHGIGICKEKDIAMKGDLVVVITGWQSGAGFTNTLRVITVDEKINDLFATPTPQNSHECVLDLSIREDKSVRMDVTQYSLDFKEGPPSKMDFTQIIGKDIKTVPKMSASEEIQVTMEETQRKGVNKGSYKTGKLSFREGNVADSKSETVSEISLDMQDTQIWETPEYSRPINHKTSSDAKIFASMPLLGTDVWKWLSENGTMEMDLTQRDNIPNEITTSTSWETVKSVLESTQIEESSMSEQNRGQIEENEDHETAMESTQKKEKLDQQPHKNPRT